MSPRTAGLLAALVAALAYANAVGGSFVGDDRQLILENSGVHSLRNVPAMLGVGTGVPEARALRNATYAIDWFVGGGSPIAFHTTNLLLHVLATALVFALARRLIPCAALAAALLFALHPVHTESVAYVSGRKDVLATVFVLAGFLAFLRWRERGGAGALVGFIAAFVAGVLSKEVACVLPVLCLAYDAADGGWRAVRARWPLYAAGAALGVLVAAAVLFQWKVSAVAGADGFHWAAGTFGESAPTLVRVVARYLALLVFPVRLLADYSFDAFPISTGWGDPRAILALGIVGIAFVATVVAWRRERRLGFACVWIAVALAPVAQIIPHHELLSEHDLYLPSVGMCLVGGWLFSSRRAGPLLAAACILFAALTVRRNAEWRDSRAILESTVHAAPRCARAQNNLARLEGQAGDAAALRRRLLEVVAIGPGRDAPASRAYAAAEIALAEQANRAGSTGAAEAESRLRRAIDAMPLDPLPRLSLASVLGRQGRVAEAASVLEDGIRRGIDEALVLQALARARGQAGHSESEVLGPLAASMRAGRPDIDAREAAFLLLQQCEQHGDDALGLVACRALGRTAEASTWRRRFLIRARSEGDLARGHAGARKRALDDARRESDRCASIDVPHALDSAAFMRALDHLRAHVRLALAPERERVRPSTPSDEWQLANADFKKLFGVVH